MAAERDAGVACAGCVGAALSRLAAIPRQRPGDGRAGDGRDHDRCFARGAVARVAGPQRAGPRGPSGAAIVCTLARHRRAGPRHLRAHPVRRARDARHGGGGRAVGGTGRSRGGQRRRLPRRPGGPRADARDRRVPGISAAGAGAGVRRGAEAGHHQCGHRHRADRVAALCAAGACRHADRARAPTSSPPCG